MNRIILATGLMTALVVSAMGPSWSTERSAAPGARIATVGYTAAPMDFDGFVRSIGAAARGEMK